MTWFKFVAYLAIFWTVKKTTCKCIKNPGPSYQHYAAVLLSALFS